MRLLVSAFVALVLAGQALPAVADNASCHAALDTISGVWRAISYLTPAKPPQCYVIGRDGHRSTSVQVTYMRTQLNLAARECSGGNSSSAIERVTVVHRLLSE
jgi:hypothetical protein